MNALDVAVLAYNSISVLRQQMKPTWRVHSIISNGGIKPNIIPEASEIQMYCRSPTIQEMDLLVSKVTSCFQAAAQATGCEVKINKDNFNTNVKQNSSLAEAFGDNFHALGVEFGDVGTCMHPLTWEMCRMWYPLSIPTMPLALVR